EVAAEERVLVLGRPGARRVAAQVGVPADGAALAPARHEVRHPDAGGKAGRAFGAGGAVEHVLRPAEALLGQRVVQPFGIVALKGREQFPLGPALEIGAGLRGRHVELGRDGQRVARGRRRERFSGFGWSAAPTLASTPKSAKPSVRYNADNPAFPARQTARKGPGRCRQGAPRLQYWPRPASPPPLWLSSARRALSSRAARARSSRYWSNSALSLL